MFILPLLGSLASLLLGCQSTVIPPQQVVGSIAAGSGVLTLNAASDFEDGQGILIVGAGRASTLSSPRGIAAKVIGVKGHTTYEYEIVEIDAEGGLSAPAQISVTNGNASLSADNFNALRVGLDPANPRAYVVYGRTAGQMHFLGFMGAAVVEGQTKASFYDTGGIIPGSPRPAFVPLAPPIDAQNDFLISKIIAGGGTMTLNLRDEASATITDAIVLRDDSEVIADAIESQSRNGARELNLRAGIYNINSFQNSSPGNRSLLYFDGLHDFRLSGASGVVFRSMMPNETILEFQDSSNIVVSGICFQGQNVGYADTAAIANSQGGILDYGTNTGGSAIRLTNVSGAIISNNNISGGSLALIWLTGGTTNSMVDWNYIHDSGGAGIGEDSCSDIPSFDSCGPTVRPLHNSIQHNRLIATAGGNSTGQIATDSGGSETDTRIMDNYVAGGTGNPWARGIEINNSGDVLVSGNFVYEAESDGIVYGVPGGAQQTDVTITGNSVVLGSGNGMVLYCSHGCGTAISTRISENKIVQCQLNGVEFLGDTAGVFNGGTILDNVIYKNFTRSAVNEDAMYIKASNFVIRRNLMDGNGSLFPYGLRIDPASVGITNSDNQVINSSLPGNSASSVLTEWLGRQNSISSSNRELQFKR